MLVAAGLFNQSCTKDPGFNGKRTIAGKVTYPDGPAVGATVTIKFNATTPAEDYDYATVTDKDGNYTFSALAAGDYFVDATFTCPKGMYFTSPGAKVTVGSSKGDNVVVDLDLQ